MELYYQLPGREIIQSVQMDNEINSVRRINHILRRDWPVQPMENETYSA